MEKKRHTRNKQSKTVRIVRLETLKLFYDENELVKEAEEIRKPGNRIVGQCANCLTHGFLFQDNWCKPCLHEKSKELRPMQDLVTTVVNKPDLSLVTTVVTKSPLSLDLNIESKRGLSGYLNVKAKQKQESEPRVSLRQKDLGGDAA